MSGKRKCEILKEIRQRIADENNIPFKTHECSYKGECSGTCPRCESELHYLEKQLEKRISLGKKVKIGMLCAGMALTVAGCSEINAVVRPVADQLSGALETAPTPTPTEEVFVTEGEVAWFPPEKDEKEAEPTPTSQIQEIDQFELLGDVPYFDEDTGNG